MPIGPDPVSAAAFSSLLAGALQLVLARRSDLLSLPVGLGGAAVVLAGWTWQPAVHGLVIGAAGLGLLGAARSASHGTHRPAVDLAGLLVVAAAMLAPGPQAVRAIPCIAVALYGGLLGSEGRRRPRLSVRIPIAEGVRHPPQR
jgi:hypothetical protein